MRKILFGAGKTGLSSLRYFKDDVAYFCDNNKAGQTIQGIKVLPFDDLKNLSGRYDVVISISDPKAMEEVRKQLDENNISYSEIGDFDGIKYCGELEYWEKQYKNEKGLLKNDFYESLMLSIAEEPDDSFLADMVVADFGCGPRGSLAWMQSPRAKMGIDVLAADYARSFGDNIARHGMFYITCTEHVIPIPDKSIDCLITINSLDHVRNLKTMCDEMLRILKPEGLFLGSFNLFEPKTECEPQTFNEKILHYYLLDYFNINSYP